MWCMNILRGKMIDFRMAVIGFGNVGQGFSQIIKQNIDDLHRRYGMKLSIVAVSDINKGSVYDPEGLDIDLLLQAAAQNDLRTVPAKYHGWDALKTICESNTNVVVEVSYTDLKNGEPALTYIKTALMNHKHVITTNKGPIALHYKQLAELAQQMQVGLGFEGTVMSGTPALGLAKDYLFAAGIYHIQGILNGTTNYILSQMDSGAPYEQALAEAQRLGYAEADPRGDVEGYDAAAKVVILAKLFMDASISLKDVERTGITHLTQADIAQARQAGECWKLIGSIEKQERKVIASVQPMRLARTHPLAGVSGATNAITYSTSLLGEVTLIGAGAGRLETGYAILQDLLSIMRKDVKDRTT